MYIYLVSKLNFVLFMHFEYVVMANLIVITPGLGDEENLFNRTDHPPCMVNNLCEIVSSVNCQMNCSSHPV